MNFPDSSQANAGHSVLWVLFRTTGAKEVSNSSSKGLDTKDISTALQVD